MNNCYFMNMHASKVPLTNDKGHQACLLLFGAANRKTTK